MARAKEACRIDVDREVGRLWMALLWSGHLRWAERSVAGRVRVRAEKVRCALGGMRASALGGDATCCSGFIRVVRDGMREARREDRSLDVIVVAFVKG